MQKLSLFSLLLKRTWVFHENWSEGSLRLLLFVYLLSLDQSFGSLFFSQPIGSTGCIFCNRFNLLVLELLVISLPGSQFHWGQGCDIIKVQITGTCLDNNFVCNSSLWILDNSKHRIIQNHSLKVFYLILNLYSKLAVADTDIPAKKKRGAPGEFSENYRRVYFSSCN